MRDAGQLRSNKAVLPPSLLLHSDATPIVSPSMCWVPGERVPANVTWRTNGGGHSTRLHLVDALYILVKGKRSLKERHFN